MQEGPFGDCKRAKLHRADRVQSSMALLAIDTRTQSICACSDNINGFLNFSPDDLIGKRWHAFLAPEHVETALLPKGSLDAELHHIHEITTPNAPLVTANHTVGHTTLVEIERRQLEYAEFSSADMIAYLHALTAAETVETVARLLMDTVATITGFDRTMLYKFLPGWHGEVIAETLRPGVEGFLGLRFPESDLPANARLLYLRNWKRAIDDIDTPSSPILRATDCDELDLTFSLARAVHPAHTQYLRNIGTRASFSISIISAGRLWGLIACHHLSPKKISLQRQTLCEHLSRVTSLRISDMEALQIEKSRGAYRVVQAEIKGALRSQEHTMRAVATQLAPIYTIFRAGGVCAHLDGHDYHGGAIPDEAGRDALREVVSSYATTDVTACGVIPPELARDPQLLRLASGFLHIPLGGGDFVLVVRPAQTETVNWAGKPRIWDAEPGTPLTPRASFHKWSQLVHGVSEPWSEVDIEAASNLRQMLIEYAEEIRLEGLALHDSLTGLANRHLLERKLGEAVAACEASDRLTAVYMLDLDRFKPVNDTMGHAAGDALLVQIARRLKENVRATDVVARLGGDEFTIIQTGLIDADAVGQTAQRILADIRRPFSIFDEMVEIGVSIGVALCPVHAEDGRELLRRADIALYRAKNAGRDCFVMFESSMIAPTEAGGAVHQGPAHAVER